MSGHRSLIATRRPHLSEKRRRWVAIFEALRLAPRSVRLVSLAQRQHARREALLRQCTATKITLLLGKELEGAASVTAPQRELGRAQRGRLSNRQWRFTA